MSYNLLTKTYLVKILLDKTIMSELIKKLAVEAGATLRPGYVLQENYDSVWTENVRIEHSELDIQKFTRLVMRETFDWISFNVGLMESHEWEALKNHFGVKE